jgi:hypothetical protein
MIITPGHSDLDGSPFVPEESFPSDPSSFQTHLNANQGQSAELDGSMDLAKNEKLSGICF